MIKCKHCKKLTNNEKFCSRSCWATYKNIHNNPMKNPKAIEKVKKTKKRLFKQGKIKVWNKGLKGNEYLKHYKNKETWLIKKQKDKNLKKEFTERALKTKKKRGSQPKGKNHPWYGKTKDNYEPAMINSKKMKKNNPNKNGRLWKNQEFRDKIKEARNLKPNKSEEVIINLITENNLPFKYVGDYSYWVDKFNPDFISTDGSKKIIEFNGNYWHKMKEHVERDKRKLETYMRLGYQLLVIWGHELKNLNEVLNKIQSFVK